MDGNEIFKEIIKSPKLKELLNIPLNKEIKAELDVPSDINEISVIQEIINAHIRHTSEDGLFKNITKIYDL